MDYSEVIEQLKAKQNAAGIKRWKERTAYTEEFESFGIGLTVLRKLAKEIGRNRDLALELWQSDLYDAKIIALLIDDPKQITPEQAESQVAHAHMDQGHLAHVFSSCDASLAKTYFVAELALEWMISESSIRRRCSYGLVYELSKSKKKSAPDADYFLACVGHIRDTFEQEDLLVQASMGGALLGIGKRSAELNAAALKLAQKIGPIPIESERGKCEPFDVVKHLTSSYVKEKLGLN